MNDDERRPVIPYLRELLEASFQFDDALKPIHLDEPKTTRRRATTRLLKAIAAIRYEIIERNADDIIDLVQRSDSC